MEEIQELREELQELKEGMEETQLSQGVFDGYLGDLMSYSFFFGELCFLGAKLRLHLFYCRYPRTCGGWIPIQSDMWKNLID